MLDYFRIFTIISLTVLSVCMTVVLVRCIGLDELSKNLFTYCLHHSGLV